jgi:hypothetical protein
MLGIYPFAPLRVLAIVRPRLPEWLPEVTLRGVRVGRATVDLGFTRRDDGSAAYRVIRRRGPLLVVAAPPPQPVDADELGWSESLKRGGLAHAPGTLARAARLAMGWMDEAAPARSDQTP